MPHYKTPEYTRRAINNYQKERDKIQFHVDKGEREKWKAAGMDYPEITRILRAEYEKRTGESSRAQNTETTENPMPKPTEPDQKPETEKKDDIPFFD